MSISLLLLVAHIVSCATFYEFEHNVGHLALLTENFSACSGTSSFMSNEVKALKLAVRQGHLELPKDPGKINLLKGPVH